MKVLLKNDNTQLTHNELLVLSAFSKKDADGKDQIVNNHWTKELKDSFSHIKSSKHYSGEKGKTFKFSINGGCQVLVLGLGDKSNLTQEELRKQMAVLLKGVNDSYSSMNIHLDGLKVKNNLDQSFYTCLESFELANYKFDRHFKENKREFIA